MSGRFEIVQTDADQAYHVRVIADNGEQLLTSENLEHKHAALRVLLALAETFGARQPHIVKSTTGQPDYLLGCDRAVPITYRDERAS